MAKISKVFIISFITLAMLTSGAFAKVSSEEAAKLGKELTPIGAEKAGNADGTIPEWTGGITSPPAGYKDDGTTNLLDPYKDDKILFTITAQNYKEYKDKLSAGQIAMFEAYPETFKMNIYPTRRSAAFPQYVYDAVKKNAVNAELNPDTYSSKGWTTAYPFPVPKTGLEVLYNHLFGYLTQTGTYYSITEQAIMGRNGDFTTTRLKDIICRTMNKKGAPLEDITLLFKQETLAPPRQAGRILVVREYLDLLNQPRQAWLYNPGQRRVRRAPTVAYDGPGTASDGLRTTDDYNMYNGSPDRYNVKLVGKVEVYLPYNCYTLKNSNTKNEDVLTQFHINPDLVRYELHRAWKLELTLKEGMRHIYKKRVLYHDEDSWYCLLSESYDKRDQLWRVNMLHTMQHYLMNGYIPHGLFTWYDLQARRYLAFGLVGGIDKHLVWDVEYPRSDFSASSIRRAGVR